MTKPPEFTHGETVLVYVSSGRFSSEEEASIHGELIKELIPYAKVTVAEVRTTAVQRVMIIQVTANLLGMSVLQLTRLFDEHFEMWTLVRTKEINSLLKEGMQLEEQQRARMTR